MNLYSLCLILTGIVPPTHVPQLTSVLKVFFVLDHDAPVKWFLHTPHTMIIVRLLCIKARLLEFMRIRIKKKLLHMVLFTM